METQVIGHGQTKCTELYRQLALALLKNVILYSPLPRFYPNVTRLCYVRVFAVANPSVCRLDFICSTVFVLVSLTLLINFMSRDSPPRLDRPTGGLMLSGCPSMLVPRNFCVSRFVNTIVYTLVGRISPNLHFSECLRK